MNVNGPVFLVYTLFKALYNTPWENLPRGLNVLSYLVIFIHSHTETTEACKVRWGTLIAVFSGGSWASCHLSWSAIRPPGLRLVDSCLVFPSYHGKILTILFLILVTLEFGTSLNLDPRMKWLVTKTFLPPCPESKSEGTCSDVPQIFTGTWGWTD